MTLAQDSLGFVTLAQLLPDCVILRKSFILAASIPTSAKQGS